MTTFNKDLRNYIDQVINTHIDYRNSNLIELDFQKKTGFDRFRGDMYFRVDAKGVYVELQKSSMDDDFEVVMDKSHSEMSKADWKKFYDQVSKMKRRNDREDLLKRISLYGVIWINEENLKIL